MVFPSAEFAWAWVSAAGRKGTREGKKGSGRGRRRAGNGMRSDKVRNAQAEEASDRQDSRCTRRSPSSGTT